MSVASTGGASFACRRGLFFLPFGLAFFTSVIFFLSSTSKLHIHQPSPSLDFSKIQSHQAVVNDAIFQQIITPVETRDEIIVETNHLESPSLHQKKENTKLDSVENADVYHHRSLFETEYAEMKAKMKIYAYPHARNDPFANVLLPVDPSPAGNYASESYFKKSLFQSSFLTSSPSSAHLFYLPFSIASLRHDKRIGPSGIPDFIRDYIHNITRAHPFWNRTGGSDHFYVACHSIGRTAMTKAVQVKLNAIQVVCSSSYFLSGYVSHKDASIPQIWPRAGKAAPTRSPSKRKQLAFYAGAMNSRVREHLVETWGNDSDISVHGSRLDTPYSEALLGSRFCIHAKGFEVNTARIADALYYGCIPVVLADHYDLPYSDILDWRSFAVVLSTSDIPMLKRILQGISEEEYVRMQGNVMRVRKHFQWHDLPVDYDAFHMVMYELWVRRGHVRMMSLSEEDD